MMEKESSAEVVDEPDVGFRVGDSGRIADLLTIVVIITVALSYFLR
jgi:hypothetical protein